MEQITRYNFLKIITLAMVAFGLAALMTFSVFFGSQTSAQSADSDLKIIAFGDSLTKGVGTDKTYHEYLEEWIGLDIENAGLTGDSTEEALERLERDVLDQDPDIVLVFLGGNDFINRVDAKETFDNLVEINERIIDSGATPILLALHGRVFLRSQERIYQAVANEVEDVEYVPEVFSGIIGRSFYFNDIRRDPVHPNANGHELIAERTFPVLRDVLNDRDKNADLFAYCRINFADETKTFDKVNQDARVSWLGYAWGGDDDDYDYEYIYDNDVVGSDRDISTRGFGSIAGDFKLDFRVKVDGETKTDRCPDLEIIGDNSDDDDNDNNDGRDLAGFCSVNINATTRTVRYGAQGYGGDGDFEYTWTTRDKGQTFRTDDFKDVFFRYSNPGDVEATVEIESDGEKIQLTCGGEISDQGDTDSEGFFGANSDNQVSALGGSCTPSIRFGSQRVTYSADVSGVPQQNRNFDDVDVTWKVSDKTIKDTLRISGTYDNDGKHRVDLDIETIDDQIDLRCEVFLVD